MVLKLFPKSLRDRMQLWRRPFVRTKLRRIERQRLEECYRYDALLEILAWLAPHHGHAG